MPIHETLYRKGFGLKTAVFLFQWWEVFAQIGKERAALPAEDKLVHLGPPLLSEFHFIIKYRYDACLVDIMEPALERIEILAVDVLPVGQVLDV